MQLKNNNYSLKKTTLRNSSKFNVSLRLGLEGNLHRRKNTKRKLALLLNLGFVVLRGRVVFLVLGVFFFFFPYPRD